MAVQQLLLTINIFWRFKLKTENKVVELVEAVEGLTETEVELFPAVEFPFNKFPEDLRQLVEKMGEAYGVTSACVASSMITVVSAAIGNTVRVKVKDSWNEPIFIWMAILGKTGSGKTPFVRSLLNPVFKKQNESVRDYKKMEAVYIKTKKSNKDNEDAVEPKLIHYYMSDTTIESVEENTKNSPRGFIIHCDELAGFIKSHNQYKKDGADRQRYLELWNCNPWKRDRIGRGSEFIVDTGCSILGGIQPSILPGIFKVDSFVDGFLPRILITIIEDKPVPFSKTEITASDIQPWEDLISKCYDITLDKKDTGENKHKILSLTEEAINEFAQFHDRYTERSMYLSDKAAGFIPKLISYTIRLSGILHIINSSGTISDGDNIDVETIKIAIRITDYFAGQSMQVFKYYSGNKNISHINKAEVVKALLDLKDNVKNGKLSLSHIVENVNSKLPCVCKLSNQKVGYLLSELGLSTKISGGYSHLVWDVKKLEDLFCFYIKPSTSSTKKKELTKKEMVTKQLCTGKEIL